MEVQSVLDSNRHLIQQANDHHCSKIPCNLAMNVEVIREIYANIFKFIRLYSDLSESFSNIVQCHAPILKNVKFNFL
ncbi:protein early flowering 4 [Phtheirospermum japonicum]|uniref:Protein early flowering 4 n=1 Tax=Phtheirospermum japonicum TaxID=374723 RepID=A0A830B1L5_9LAMI|nr:protein early flowering 4 [Phtheirospermum japonicum]